MSEINWQKVADDLRETAVDAAKKADVLSKGQPAEPNFDRHGSWVG